jgi:hypothetical protein
MAAWIVVDSRSVLPKVPNAVGSNRPRDVAGSAGSLGPAIHNRGSPDDAPMITHVRRFCQCAGPVQPRESGVPSWQAGSRHKPERLHKLAQTGLFTTRDTNPAVAAIIISTPHVFTRVPDVGPFQGDGPIRRLSKPKLRVWGLVSWSRSFLIPLTTVTYFVHELPDSGASKSGVLPSVFLPFEHRHHHRSRRPHLSRLASAPADVGLGIL